MAETLKAHQRRIREGWFEKYTPGGPGKTGIDIGCSNDPVRPEALRYDKEINPTHDAERCDDLIEAGRLGKFDWVYSSHCLEHMRKPFGALRAWFSLVKPGGHLIVLVPHRDLYEKKRVLPSNWNGDHKFFFLPGKSEPPHTIGIDQLIAEALPPNQYHIVHIHTLADGYRANGTNHSEGEYSIEFIIAKNPNSDSREP